MYNPVYIPHIQNMSKMKTISCFTVAGFGSSSIPIGIPPCSIPRGSVGSLSQSPTSPYGSFPHSIIPLQTQKESHTEVRDEIAVSNTLSSHDTFTYYKHDFLY